MKLKALNSYLMIVINGPKLKIFDFERVFDVWQRFSRHIVNSESNPNGWYC